MSSWGGCSRAIDLELMRLGSFRLHARVALMTGAAQGMGLAFTEALALNGARVAMSDANRDKLEAASGGLLAKGYHIGV
jgi:NAD(P)-dependent dehydrogenase (short-subunit alcohol dehydrogenase family)